MGFQVQIEFVKLKISPLPNLFEKYLWKCVRVCVFVCDVFPSTLTAGQATFLLNDLYFWEYKNEDTKSGVGVINKPEKK